MSGVARIGFLLSLLSIAAMRADVSAAEMLANAARVGNVETAKSLLSAGVDPNSLDRYGVTPLYYAASLSKTAIVELLLAYQADPNAPARVIRRKEATYTATTPLHFAAEFADLRMAGRLIAAGAHLDTRNATGRTALHFAGRHLDMIRLLIEKGADVNARDAEGTSALDDAAWRGSLDAVAILLAHGAHLNDVQPVTGATPVNEAAYRGMTAVVRYLLEFGPDLETADKRGYRPLDNAIRMGKEDAAVLLLEAKTKRRETPKFLEEAMNVAIQKDESVLVEALLRYGVLANEVSSSGSTLLDAAASAGASKVVRVLLDKGADPNASGRNGTSALEDAALQGSDANVSMLLDHGAQVNYVNSSSGTTALYAAAAFGKSGVAELLLLSGAKPNLCGRNGKTPYQAAVENGYKEVAAQVKTHGGGRTCE